MPSIKPLDSYRQIRSRGELFVGRGDSILLHTVLKYELLELVVGLNFDPKENLKGMFQTLGPILHKDCFGTFDLVLVDLSETVMSFQVIMDQLDVLEDLTLLVKPYNMIFVKSKVYFSQFKNYFHTVHCSNQLVSCVCPLIRGTCLSPTHSFPRVSPYLLTMSPLHFVLKF
jgi:hypothetical protein